MYLPRRSRELHSRRAQQYHGLNRARVSLFAASKPPLEPALKCSRRPVLFALDLLSSRASASHSCSSLLEPRFRHGICSRRYPGAALGQTAQMCDRAVIGRRLMSGADC